MVEIQSMTRRRAEIDNGHSTYIFCGITPLCNNQYRNRVHFYNFDTVRDDFTKLGRNIKHDQTKCRD